jgi:hypothetical protein
MVILILSINHGEQIVPLKVELLIPEVIANKERLRILVGEMIITRSVGLIWRRDTLSCLHHIVRYWRRLAKHRCARRGGLRQRGNVGDGRISRRKVSLTATASGPSGTSFNASSSSFLAFSTSPVRA